MLAAQTTPYGKIISIIREPDRMLVANSDS
jgi:hypothetical protein